VEDETATNNTMVLSQQGANERVVGGQQQTESVGSAAASMMIKSNRISLGLLHFMKMVRRRRMAKWRRNPKQDFRRCNVRLYHHG
jgi:hypothetical protein